MPIEAAAAARQPFLLDMERFRRRILWLFVASGSFAAIEPSPYELMFLVALIAFGPSGLLLDRAMIPLILLLAAFNAGGLLSLVPFVDVRDSVTFVLISIYVAVTAIFFAGIIARDPLARLRTIRSGYIATAFVASILGIIGYFDIAGLGQYFTVYDNARASGPFKDPNVFGPFLALPATWLAQDILLGRSKGLLRTLVPLTTILVAVLLSFSRGAWGALIASCALMAALTFLTTTSTAMRQRIVALMIAAIFFLAILLTVALSIPAISSVLIERASLSQDYDVGELGRFGAQLRSIPMLLELPFGFGPLRYDTIFPAAPHEVYINAFASYGWLGGLSLVTFTGVTLYVGFRLVFQRSKYQAESIAIWSCLLPQMVQGLQIDTDHWRHLYLMFGCLYGLAAATRLEAPAAPSRATASLRGDRPVSENAAPP